MRQLQRKRRLKQEAADSRKGLQEIGGFDELYDILKILEKLRKIKEELNKYSLERVNIVKMSILPKLTYGFKAITIKTPKPQGNEQTDSKRYVEILRAKNREDSNTTAIKVY